MDAMMPDLDGNETTRRIRALPQGRDLPVVFLTLNKTNANTVGGGQPVLTGPGFVDETNAETVAQLAEEGTR